MQRFFTSIRPAFLQRLDHHLLVNRPFVWATRIHHVLFWGLLGNVFALIYGYLLPIAEYDLASPWSGTLVLLFPALLGLVLWGKSLQETGYWTHQMGIKSRYQLRNMFLFGLGSLLLSAMPMVFYTIVELRLTPTFLHYGIEESQSYGIVERWMMLVFPFVWMCVELFAYLRWAQIIWAFVIGLGLIVLETAISGILITSTMGRSISGVFTMILLLLLVQLCAFVVTAYNTETRSAFGRTWQAICLVFSSFILLLLPFIIWVGVAIDNKIESVETPLLIVCLSGLGLAGTIWHFGFRKRVMELQALPQK